MTDSTYLEELLALARDAPGDRVDLAVLVELDCAEHLDLAHVNVALGQRGGAHDVGTRREVGQHVEVRRLEAVHVDDREGRAADAADDEQVRCGVEVHHRRRDVGDRHSRQHGVARALEGLGHVNQRPVRDDKKKVQNRNNTKGLEAH